jgi:hypothetical protein
MVSKLAAKLKQGGSSIPHLPSFGRRQIAEVTHGPSSLQRTCSVDTVPPHHRPLEQKSSTVRKRWAYKTCLAEIVSTFQSSQNSRDRVLAHKNGKQDQRRSSTSTTVSSVVDAILQSPALMEYSSSPEYQEHRYAVSKCDLVGRVDEKLALASMEGEYFEIMRCERLSSKADIQTNDNINVHNDDGNSCYLQDLESILEEPSSDKMSSAVPRRSNYSPRSDFENSGSGSNQKSESRSSASIIDRKSSYSTHRRRLSRRTTSTRHLDVNNDTLRSSGSHHQRRSRESLSYRNLLPSPSTALSAGTNEQEDVSKTISSKSSNQSERDEDATSDDSALEKESRVGRIQSRSPYQTRRPSRSTITRSKVLVDWRKKAEGFEKLLDDLRVSSTEFRSHISKENTTEQACNDREDSRGFLQNSGNGKGCRRGNSLWTYHEGPPTCHDRSTRPLLTRQRSIKCLLLSDNVEDDVPPISLSFKEHSIQRRG